MVVVVVFCCIGVLMFIVVSSEDCELSAELSYRHLLDFVIERCSDVAPRFVDGIFCFFSHYYSSVYNICSFSIFGILLLFVSFCLEKVCVMLYLCIVIYSFLPVPGTQEM